MTHDEDPTLTVFRKYRNNDAPWYGDIVALFPEIPAYDSYCLCYQHVGQHGSADYSFVINITEPAKPEEYQDLKEELERIGYRLKIRKKWTRK